MSDLNGRTSNLADFIENDANQHIPLPHDYEIDLDTPLKTPIQRRHNHKLSRTKLN